MQFRLYLILVCCLLGPGQSIAQAYLPAKVLVFMAPTCPICQYYTSDLKHYRSLFDEEDVEWELVFPGKLRKREIVQFMDYYGLDFSWKRDRRAKMALQYGVSRTPEACILQEGRLVYRGAIDNAWADLGQMRGSVTQYPLRKMLYIVTNSRLTDLIETEAIGCLIERAAGKE